MRLTKKDVEAVPCSRCGAKEGEPCRVKKDNSIAFESHTPRWRLALQAENARAKVMPGDIRSGEQEPRAEFPDGFTPQARGRFGPVDLVGGVVEIEVRNNTLWVNVDGLCVTRVYRANVIQYNGVLVGGEPR